MSERSPHNPTTLQRYGVAALVIVLALLLRAALSHFLHGASPFIAFTPAIAFAALYGGVGPGILATALGLVLASAFVLRDDQLELDDLADVTQVTLYLLAGLLISWLGGRARAAQKFATRQQRERLRSEERFHAVVEGITDCAIFLLDPEGRITSWNSGAQRIKGYSFDEVVGQHLSMFDPPHERAQGRSHVMLREAERSGSIRTQGWRLRKDGGTFLASEMITAIRDPDGRLRGFVKLTWDATHAVPDQARQLTELTGGPPPPPPTA